MGAFGAVLAQVGEDNFDRDQIEFAIIVLMVVCGIGMVAVLRTVGKASTRLALLGLLFVIGIGLYLQREELDDCRGRCTCHVFGMDVDMPEVGGLTCPR